MKHTRALYFAVSAAVCLLAVSACQKDRMSKKSASGLIRTRVSADRLVTKSSLSNEKELTNTIALGDSLVLLEFVSDNVSQPMEGHAVQTKGAVITTANIGDEYGLFGMEAFISNFDFPDGEAPVLTDGDQYISGGTVQYSSEDNSWALAPEYHWLPDVDYEFWSYAPKTHSGAYSFGSTGSRTMLSIDDYVSELEAKDQLDLLFAYNQRRYDDSHTDEFIDINFRHALAQICFNVESITDYTVTKIQIIGAYGKGDCAVEGADLDDSDVSKAFTWTPDAETKPTFIMAGAADNFFLIPQTLPEGAKISITLEKDGVESTLDADLKSIEWKAGKYYMYTLNYKDAISVEVTEDFIEGGDTKENVGAKNTSSAGVAYLRMAITANWVDASGNIADACDFETDGTLVDYLESSNWVKNTDGFYYYKLGVRPGQETVDKIFTSYTAPEAPAAGLKLEMAILVQGVKFDLDKAKAAWGIGDGILTTDIEGAE